MLIHYIRAREIYVGLCRISANWDILGFADVLESSLKSDSELLIGGEKGSFKLSSTCQNVLLNGSLSS